jgi:hypothetical protein
VNLAKVARNAVAGSMSTCCGGCSSSSLTTAKLRLSCASSTLRHIMDHQSPHVAIEHRQHAYV